MDSALGVCPYCLRQGAGPVGSPNAHFHLFPSSLTPSSPSYLEEALEVWLVVRASLQQRGAVELARAEPDVRLHVAQLGRQDVSDLLHRRVLASVLLTKSESPVETLTVL